MNRLRIIFCGTPQFAVPSLRHLLEQPDFEVTAVITQPDRARGRGQEISHSPVKQVALEAKLHVFQPEKIRTPESEQLLREIAPDAIVIIAYGQIIPAHLLDIPKLGWINLHGSLLPKYRGAAPIQWAIANGETKTGVTTMRIDAGMDTGDTLLRAETPIGSVETTPQLAERLAALGAPLVSQTLRALRDNSIQPSPQNHAEATTAPLLKKEDGRIQWSRTAQGIYNRMRAFTPWPGAFTSFRGTVCHISGQPVSNKLSAVRSHVEGHTAAPGTILFDGEEMLVACGEETLLSVSHVKFEGRKQVSALDFANGAHVRTGEQFAAS